MSESQNFNQCKAIEKACLDYVEGFYEGSAERMATGVHQSLAKRRVNGPEVSDMSRETLIAIASGHTRPKPGITVQILDVSGNMAAAKITSDFIDYAHLALIDGVWQVINVLWDMA